MGVMVQDIYHQPYVARFGAWFICRSLQIRVDPEADTRIHGVCLELRRLGPEKRPRNS